MPLFKDILLSLGQNFKYSGLWKSIYYTYQQFYGESEKIFRTKPKLYKFPLYLRAKSSDIPTFNQVISFQEYMINIDFIPNVIIDCGANIGLASVYFINKYPKCKIIAVEPEKSNYEMLLLNTAKYDNISCLNYAIWDHDCFLNIIDTNVDKWAFQVEETKIESDIKAITIGKIIEIYNITSIDILKIDIEGSEKKIFEKDYKNWLPLVKILMIELHDRITNSCAESVFRAIASSNKQYKFEIQGETLIFFFI